MELAQHLTVAGAIEGLLGLDQGVEGQDAEAQAFDLEQFPGKSGDTLPISGGVSGRQQRIWWGKPPPYQ